MKYGEIFAAACEYAPLELSDALVKVENGYDNSGIIIETEREITKVLVTLDLTVQSVEYAISNGYELIITHHPAIYMPIKKLDLKGNRALTLCALNGIGVFSMHLNLDIADEGIDYYLAKGIGAKKQKILTCAMGERGYGRLFNIEKTTLNALKQHICNVFECDNIMVFGNREREIKKVASFCGAGCDIKELDLAEGADAVVSADFKHHVIREALNRGMCVVQMTHYASENYGMRFFASALSAKLYGVKFTYYNSAEY